MCNLCGSFVLCVYAFLYVAAALPLLSALLVAQPTPAVMAAELLRTHAQRRNRFLALCLAETKLCQMELLHSSMQAVRLDLCASHTKEIFVFPAE